MPVECPHCRSLRRADVVACPNCGHAPQLINGYPAWAPALADQSDGFKPEYFATLATLEEASFWFRSRNALINTLIRTHCPSFSSLLEVGCGTGFVLSYLSRSFPNRRLMGSEVFSNGLAIAAARCPDAAFVQMDGRDIPFREEFELVAALDVIEHIHEDQLVLNNLHRALQPGGWALISVPQHEWLWSPVDEFSCHVRRYRKVDLHQKVRAAGFEIIRSTSFAFLTLPLMLLSRLTYRLGERDPRAEQRLPRAIDGMLASILGIERALIRLRLNLPVGGSRVVLARKAQV